MANDRNKEATARLLGRVFRQLPARTLGCARLVTLAALILGATLASTAQAQSTPRLIPFQGRLTDEAGAARNGTYQLVFTIYNASTQGTQLWQEVHPSVSVSSGQINVLLGSITPLDDPNKDGNVTDAVSFAASDGPRFLGIRVGDPTTGQEMLPRQRLVPAFYAAGADYAKFASSVTSVGLGAVTEQSIASGAVIADKIAGGAVDESKLSGSVNGQLSTAASNINSLQATALTLASEQARPKAYWDGVIMLPTGVSMGTLADSGPFVQIVNSSLKMKALASIGDITPSITCQASLVVGDECGGNPESVGFAFDPPRTATYEVCMAGHIFLRGFNAKGAVRLRLARTLNVSSTLIQGESFQQGASIGFFGNSDDHYMVFPFELCRSQVLSPTERVSGSVNKDKLPTWRLWYSGYRECPTCSTARGEIELHKASMAGAFPIPGAVTSETAPESGFDSLVRITIKEQ